MKIRTPKVLKDICSYLFFVQPRIEISTPEAGFEMSGRNPIFEILTARDRQLDLKKFHSLRFSTVCTP
jgi:hypothetical protein